MSSEPNQNQELLLTAKLEQDPSDWDTRQQLAHLLYDKGQYGMAAAVIWEADQIPSTDLDLAFAARILSKDQPRKAIRLLTAVLELNKGKAVQNMGMANALLHHGMVLQAARFYGAALEADPELVNPDLEHFILWTDEEQTLWGDFKDRRPKLGELPWMSRDPMEALKLTSRVSLHTTPIAVPKLRPVLAEDLRNSLYQQEAKKDAKITPPPAVTIPADRVKAKDRRYDSTMGAETGEDLTNRAPTAKKQADPNATQEVQIQKPAQTPAAEVEPPAENKTADSDATQEVKPPEAPKAPAAIPVQEDAKPEAKKQEAPAARDETAEAKEEAPATKSGPPPAPMSRPGSPAAGKLVVGPDGKLRRAKAEPDMEAIEAAAKAELEEKARIANIAKAAAMDADEQDDIERAARINTSRVKVPGSPQTPGTGKEELPPAERNAQREHPEPEPELTDEEAAKREEMKKTRAIARAAAREKRLNAAAAGVPLPATEGRQGEWYYIYEGEAVGPVLAEELKEKMNDPTLKPPLKMIWTSGMERWMPIYECPELWEQLDGVNA